MGTTPGTDKLFIWQLSLEQLQKACAIPKYSLETLETPIAVLITFGKQGLGINVVKKLLTIDHNMIIQKNPNADNKTKSSITKRLVRLHTAFRGIEVTTPGVAKKELFSFSVIFLYCQSQVY